MNPGFGSLNWIQIHAASTGVLTDEALTRPDSGSATLLSYDVLALHRKRSEGCSFDPAHIKCVATDLLRCARWKS